MKMRYVAAEKLPNNWGMCEKRSCIIVVLYYNVLSILSIFLSNLFFLLHRYCRCVEQVVYVMYGLIVIADIVIATEILRNTHWEAYVI